MNLFEECSHELKLIAKKGKIKNKGEVKGVMLKWTYRLKKRGETLLSYVAEDVYRVEDIKMLKELDVRKMIWSSYCKFNDEYQERMSLIDSTLSIPFVVDPSTSQKVLDDLQK